MNQMIKEMQPLFEDLTNSLQSVESEMHSTDSRRNLELIDQKLREKQNMIAEYRKLVPDDLEEVRALLVNSEHQIILLLEKLSRKLASAGNRLSVH